MARVTLEVDGRTHTLEADPDMPLLYALRNDLGMRNPRFGCGLAQCGACTVLLDDAPVRACTVPVGAVDKPVRTLAGLGSPGNPHPVQQAFIEEQVPFCGYCISGWVMHAVALLERNPASSDAEIRQFLAGLKCRCGHHTAVMRAIRRAAAAMRGPGAQHA